MRQDDAIVRADALKEHFNEVRGLKLATDSDVVVCIAVDYCWLLQIEHRLKYL